jgi:hypothetical protein
VIVSAQTIQRVLAILASMCSPIAAQTVPSDSPYFPLSEGNQWALVNTDTGLPTYLTAIGSRILGDKRQVRLRFDQVYLGFTWILNGIPDRTLIEGVDTGTSRAYFDEIEPIFRYDALPGERWVNELGTVTLVNDNQTVDTFVGRFTCRDYRIDFLHGANQNWCLADGIGPVRISDAFFTYVLLATNSIRPYTPPPANPNTVQGACPQVGVEPNPAASSDFSLSGFEGRFRQSVAAGSRFLRLSAKWSELEPAVGKYDFASLRHYFDWSAGTSVSLGFTLKTIDTSRLSLPEDLKSLPLSSPLVLERHNRLLEALAAELPPNLHSIEIGNEVGQYLQTHPAEVEAFKSLLDQGRRSVRNLRPDISVGTVFAYSEYRSNDLAFRELYEHLDHIGFTYYPLRASFQVRSPASARSDIAEMVASAAGKPLVLTEIGYPSSAELGSSPELQAQFYEVVFETLRRYPEQIRSASIFLMSDIPPSVVQDLVRYYGFDDNPKFTAFLASLGLRDLTDGAKPGWYRFEQLTSQLSGLCTRLD